MVESNQQLLAKLDALYRDYGEQQASRDLVFEPIPGDLMETRGRDDLLEEIRVLREQLGIDPPPDSADEEDDEPSEADTDAAWEVKNYLDL